MPSNDPTVAAIESLTSSIKRLDEHIRAQQNREEKNEAVANQEEKKNKWSTVDSPTIFPPTLPKPGDISEAQAQHITRNPRTNKFAKMGAQEKLDAASISMLKSQEEQEEITRENALNVSAPNYKSAHEIGTGEAFKRFFKEKGSFSNKLNSALNVPTTNRQEPGKTSSAASIPNNGGSQQQGGQGGGSSRGPSPFNERGMSSEERNDVANERIAIPWYGEWKLDEKFRLGRNVATRMANKMSPGSAGRRSLENVSDIANFGFQHAAEYNYIKEFKNKALGWATGQSEVGAALGYNPQNGLGPTDILGMRNPLAPFTSTAGQEAMGMGLEAWSASKLGTGLSGAQAKELQGGLQSMGFSNQKQDFAGLYTGGDFTNIFNATAPLLKQGFKTEDVVPFYEALKTGSVTIDEMTKSISGMKGAAQTAKQTLDAYSASVQQYTSFAVGRGASAPQAISAATGFTQATGGQPVSNLEPLLNNPMAQQLAVAKYGILPEEIGSIKGGQAAELQGATVGIVMQMAKSAPRIAGMSKQESEIAFAASQTGMPRNWVEKVIREGPTKIRAAGNLTDNYETAGSLGKVVEGMEQHKRSSEYQVRLAKARKGEIYKPGESKNFGPSRTPLTAKQVEEEWYHGTGEWGSHMRSDYHPGLTKQDKEKLKNGGQWGEYYLPGLKKSNEWMTEAGWNGKEESRWDKEYESNPRKAAETLEKKLGKSGESKIETAGGVGIELRGSAAKLFRLVSNEAGAGGESTAQQAVH